MSYAVSCLAPGHDWSDYSLAGCLAAGCVWSDYGRASCSGWTEIALNIICSPFLYFLECYKAKEMIEVGRSEDTIDGRDTVLIRHYRIWRLNSQFYNVKIFQS